MEGDPQAGVERLKGFFQPWHQALANPAEAQNQVLRRFLEGYAQTEYGARYVADRVETIDDYRRAFPVVTYENYKPLMQRVMAGEEKLLLYEPAIGWAITRGTPKDESKFIPMTPTDLRTRVSAGRAMMNYVAATGHFDLFAGVNLNLNFPSVVGTVRMGEREVEYGYSSGIYLKHVSASTPIRSLPTQEDIDAL